MSVHQYMFGIRDASHTLCVLYMRWGQSEEYVLVCVLYMRWGQSEEYVLVYVLYMR